MTIQAIITILFLVLLVLSIFSVIPIIWPWVCIGYLAALAVVGAFPITRG